MKAGIKPFSCIVALLLSCSCLSGCWDMVDVNELAIMDIPGIDIDRKSGEFTIYYQTINPGSIAQQKGAGIKASVYTYRVKGLTFPEVRGKLQDLLPRRVFPEHHQVTIVTERYARHGVLEFLNFLERNPDTRNNIFFLVTDSPLSGIMQTFTPMERITGRALSSLVRIQSKQTGVASSRIRASDLIERLDSMTLTVTPIVSMIGSKPASTTERLEHMNANEGNIRLNGGAVFLSDHMIGKLKRSEMPLYCMLKGESDVIPATLTMNHGKVTILGSHLKVKKQLSLSAGKPVWKVRIYADLQITSNSQKVKMSEDNVSEIKQKFNRQIMEKATRFFADSMRKKWDLFAIQKQMNRKRGKEWQVLKKKKDVWIDTKLELMMNTRVTKIGKLTDPYTNKIHDPYKGE